MYRKQVRRRRATLVALVVLALVLISTHISEGEDGPLHSVTDTIASVLSPIEEGASRALKPARDLVNWFDETFEARGQNDELQVEVSELREQVSLLQREVDLRDEIGEVGSLDGTDGFEEVAAQIIGRSSATYLAKLDIDKGASAGLARDDPVVVGEGLIGRVSDVTGGGATVTLISGADSSVTARVLEDGPTGSLAPIVGEPGTLLFDVIASDKEVRGGSMLVTASFTDGELTGLFPQGIPVGEVTSARATDRAVGQRIEVEPYADLANLPETVFVLTGGPS